MENDPTIKQGIGKLSELVIKNGIKQEIESVRKSLGIPFIQEPSVYGIDVSMLDLSNAVFMNQNMKDVCFVGTDLRNTIFINCGFSSSTFVVADMRGAELRNCKFNYMDQNNYFNIHYVTNKQMGSPFYKTKIDCTTSFKISAGYETPIKMFHDLYNDNGVSYI